MLEHKEALAKWQAMRETKYSDGEIRTILNSGQQYSGTDYANEDYAQSCAVLARAMIAYNEMIDTRIERAERSWR